MNEGIGTDKGLILGYCISLLVPAIGYEINKNLLHV